MHRVCSACEQRSDPDHFEDVKVSSGWRRRCPEVGVFATARPHPDDDELEALRLLLREKAKEDLAWGERAYQTPTGQAFVEEEIQRSLSDLRESGTFYDPSYWAELLGQDEADLLDGPADPP